VIRNEDHDATSKADVAGDEEESSELSCGAKSGNAERATRNERIRVPLEHVECCDRKYHFLELDLHLKSEKHNRKQRKRMFNSISRGGLWTYIVFKGQMMLQNKRRLLHLGMLN